MPKLSKEEAAPRMAICQECPRFVAITSGCRECGCFMKAKTRLALAKCTIGKW